MHQVSGAGDCTVLDLRADLEHRIDLGRRGERVRHRRVGAEDQRRHGLADARPADEDDWTALRRALGAVIPYYLRDRSSALAITSIASATIS